MDLLLPGLVLSNSSLHPVGVERNEGVGEKLVEEPPPLVLVVKLLHLHVPLPLPLASHKSERGGKRRKARKEQEEEVEEVEEEKEIETSCGRYRSGWKIPWKRSMAFCLSESVKLFL